MSTSRVPCWAKSNFDAQSVEYHGSDEIFASRHGFPYIDYLPGRTNVQIATVVSGTGLTFGTVRRNNAWRELYRSSRVNTEAKVNEPMRSIVIAGGRSMTSRDTSRLHRGSPEVPLDEGRILEIDGEKIPVYRDNREALHALSARCTPMDINAEWNGAAKTWDCRCHGGRYRTTGEVLCAPPTQSLARLKIP